jgi:hypothetical protein
MRRFVSWRITGWPVALGLEADPERYCNANLSPINDLSVSVAGL